MFWHAFQKIVKTISTKKLNHQWTINIFIHFLTTKSHVSWGFLPKSSSEATAALVLRIHVRLRLEEPLDHGIAAEGGCQVQRCPASGATARGQATGRTQLNEGEKNSQKIWVPQKSKFWKFWPLRNPPCNEHCGFEMFWDVLRCFEMFWWHRVGWKGHVNQVGNQNALRKLKNVPSLRKQICVRLGHNRIWNQSRAVDISCNRVRGLARILTGKKHKFLRFVRTANNDPVKQCLITVYTCIYHIRMDTPEPQKQFELWWAWHSISRLKSLSQENSDPKCRNNIVVFTNINTKHWCKCLDTLSKKLWKQHPPKSWTISEPSTCSFTSSQRNPMFHEISPPISSSEATAVFVLCIHGRLRLQEPLDHGIVASLGCVVQRCSASGAAARSQATGRTQRNEGEKSSQKILGNSKVKFWKLLPLKNLPGLNEHSGFEMFSGCFEDIELVKKTVACGVLSKPCQPCLQSRCTWINSNVLQLYQTNLPIGTPHLKIIDWFCSFAPGISFNWPNKQWQEKETSVWIMRPAEIQLSHELTSESNSGSPETVFGLWWACQPKAL